MTGPILLVIGVVALFAAIVGGGIKFRDIEVGDVKSVWRQGLLGIFGIVVSLIGLVLVIDPDLFSDTSDDTQNSASSDQNTAAIAPDASANDSNAVDLNAADTNTEPATENNTTEEPNQG